MGGGAVPALEKAECDEAPLSHVGCMDAGDAAFYDGRLLHCGGANRSDQLRMLFYVTFRHADAVGHDVSGDGDEAAECQGASVRLSDLEQELFGASDS